MQPTNPAIHPAATRTRSRRRAEVAARSSRRRRSSAAPTAAHRLRAQPWRMCPRSRAAAPRAHGSARRKGPARSRAPAPHRARPAAAAAASGSRSAPYRCTQRKHRSVRSPAPAGRCSCRRDRSGGRRAPGAFLREDRLNFLCQQFAQHHLLGEVLRAHNNPRRPRRSTGSAKSRSEQATRFASSG